jgi:integrase/recombinase XerD
MKWAYWTCLFLQTHCTARGLRSTSIAAYAATLKQFQNYLQQVRGDIEPDQVTGAQVLAYLDYLRRARHNNHSAVNRQVTILKGFYRAMVAMGHLLPRANPLAYFPTLKAPPRKLPVTLSEGEVGRLLVAPAANSIMGFRDRALLTLLYGTGIRASECAGLREIDVDLAQAQIQVTGKGGHQRVVPLNPRVVAALQVYRQARGGTPPERPFFQSRSRRSLSRNAIYERVRRYARLARIPRPVSPHKLRHTFATHLVKAGVGLVTIRDLLGHRQISSTQVYLHVTAQDLRVAAERHPIHRFTGIIEHLLPDVKLPWQRSGPAVGYG